MSKLIIFYDRFYFVFTSSTDKVIMYKFDINLTKILVKTYTSASFVANQPVNHLVDGNSIYYFYMVGGLTINSVPEPQRIKVEKSDLDLNFLTLNCISNYVDETASMTFAVPFCADY